ncbi:IS3 family transposase, partial [Escherichia coli]
RTDEGWLYLAVVIDLWSRAVIGWSMSPRMTAQLKRHNLRGSMSAKGCCYDNACVESFFHSLKVECIHGEHFISREIMRATV